MKHAVYSLLGAALLLPFVAGCGDPGVDAEQTVTQDGGPQANIKDKVLPPKEHAKKLADQLENMETPRAMMMNIGMLGQMGADAEVALPTLEKIANDDKTDEQLRERAKAAIEKIKAAL